MPDLGRSDEPALRSGLPAVSRTRAAVPRRLARPVGGTGNLASRRIAVQTPRPMPRQSKKFQFPRLRWIGNNTRFMTLPVALGYPHPDSHVLGTNLQRLGADWQAKWAHLAESAERFVDPNRFEGTRCTKRRTGWSWAGTGAIRA